MFDGFVGAGGQNTELVLRPDSSTGDLILMLEFQVLGLFFAFNNAAFASNSAALARLEIEGCQYGHPARGVERSSIEHGVFCALSTSETIQTSINWAQDVHQRFACLYSR